MLKAQLFNKNDDRDKKLELASRDIFDLLSSAKTDFYNGAWTAFDLGRVLYDIDRDPMSGVITKDTFARSFFAIHDLFTRAGTFEFYLQVFRAIWGDTANITFSIPSSGILEIDIEALEIEQSLAMAREIVDNSYIFIEMKDHNGDNLIFQDTKGIKSQREVDNLMNELKPSGVIVKTNLIIT